MKLLAVLKVGNQDSDFMLPESGGSFMDPDKFDAGKPIAKAAKMPGTRFHDLRHFFASQLIANGETAASVWDQMGHSSIKVTFDTYGHLFPVRARRRAHAMKRRWRRPGESRRLRIERAGLMNRCRRSIASN
jgi:integrase